jgi:hypothetical protein
LVAIIHSPLLPAHHWGSAPIVTLLDDQLCHPVIAKGVCSTCRGDDIEHGLPTYHAGGLLQRSDEMNPLRFASDEICGH